jgi:hypothetical protein
MFGWGQKNPPGTSPSKERAGPSGRMIVGNGDTVFHQQSNKHSISLFGEMAKRNTTDNVCKFACFICFMSIALFRLLLSNCDGMFYRAGRCDLYASTRGSQRSGDSRNPICIVRRTLTRRVHIDAYDSNLKNTTFKGIFALIFDQGPKNITFITNNRRIPFTILMSSLENANTIIERRNQAVCSFFSCRKRSDCGRTIVLEAYEEKVRSISPAAVFVHLTVRHWACLILGVVRTLLQVDLQGMNSGQAFKLPPRNSNKSPVTTTSSQRIQVVRRQGGAYTVDENDTLG